MATPPFLDGTGRSGGSGGPSYPPGQGPEQRPDNPSGPPAAAGPWMGGDNPVIEQHPSPASTGGFSTGSGGPSLPNPMNPTEGFTKPPSGRAR